MAETFDKPWFLSVIEFDMDDGGPRGVVLNKLYGPFLNKEQALACRREKGEEILVSWAEGLEEETEEAFVAEMKGNLGTTTEIEWAVDDDDQACLLTILQSEGG